MKVDQSELNYALTFCSRGIKNKPIIPAHANIVCEARGSVMYVRGINHETGFYTSINVESEQDISFAASGQDFKRIIGGLSGTLTLIPDFVKHRLIIKHAYGKYEIAVEDPHDYPDYDISKCQNIVTFKEAEFASTINAVKSVIIVDDLRPVFSSVNMDIQADNITFVGTDSHRLVMVEHIEGNPTKDVSLLLSLDVCSNATTLGGSDITIKSSGNLVVLEGDNKRIVQKKQEGNYPQYRAVVPKQFAHEVKVDKAILQGVLSRISSVSNVSNSVRLAFSNNTINIAAEDLDFGRSGEEQMQCEGQTEMTIGFNGVFLAGLLRNINGKTVTFKLTDPSRAVVLRGDDNMTSLIMPLMINN